MEQFKFDFGKQDNHLDFSSQAKNKLRLIEQHSKVYPINAPNSELINIGRNYPSHLDQSGESYVE